MYPKFIEVHLAKDDCLASLNISHIVGTVDFDNGEGYIVKTSDRGDWIVRESYEELKQMITESGCLIRKQDPLLDTEHPLTMEDIKGMVGEPVWNSNIDEWGLVTKDPEWHGEIQEGYFIRYQDGTMTYLYEEGLEKYPIYRMKVVGGR